MAPPKTWICQWCSFQHQPKTIRLHLFGKSPTLSHIYHPKNQVYPHFSGHWNRDGSYGIIMIHQWTKIHQNSMDWFVGENFNRFKPHDLHGKIYGFRWRFSLKPIHWKIHQNPPRNLGKRRRPHDRAPEHAQQVRQLRGLRRQASEVRTLRLHVQGVEVRPLSQLHQIFRTSSCHERTYSQRRCICHIFIFKPACLWHICIFPKILNVGVLPFFTTDGFLAHGHFFRTHFQPPCSVLGMKSTNTTIAESTPLHSIPHMARRFTALAVTEPVSGGVSTSSKARASSMAKRVAWAPFLNGCGKIEVSNWGISSLPVKAGKRKKQKPHQWLIMDNNI